MSAPSSSPEAGSLAPNTTFTDGAGKKLTTKDILKGSHGKPVVLAFFKTSCPTCKLSWPYVQMLHKRYGRAGARVIGVSQNDERDSRIFYNEYGHATFERLLDPEPAFVASNAFGVEAVPLVVLIGSDGQILQRFEGWQRQALEDMGQAIAQMHTLPHARLIDVNDPVPPWKAG